MGKGSCFLIEYETKLAELKSWKFCEKNKTPGGKNQNSDLEKFKVRKKQLQAEDIKIRSGRNKSCMWEELKYQVRKNEIPCERKLNSGCF